MAKEKPKKFDPVSPIKVFAGVKLNGKKPTIAPANAVISKIEIKDDSFNVNIINNEKQDINVIPEESPSKPSIKFIAFVIPIIQPIVIIYEIQSYKKILLSIKGMFIFSILTPEAVTTIAEIICAKNFIQFGIPLESSIKHVTAKIKIPVTNPNILKPYCSSEKRSIDSSKFIIINKYIIDTKKPAITASPP